MKISERKEVNGNETIDKKVMIEKYVLCAGTGVLAYIIAALVMPEG